MEPPAKISLVQGGDFLWQGSLLDLAKHPGVFLVRVDGQWLVAPLGQGLRGYRAVGLDLVGKGIPPWLGALDTFQRVATCNQSAAVTSALP